LTYRADRPARRRKYSALSPTLFIVIVSVAFVVLSLASSASAAEVLRFKEDFGSAALQTFGKPTGLAVDPSGDLLVMDQEAGTISRFNPDGTPDDFEALGTNVIEETEGPGAERLAFAEAGEAQIAVDTSGGPTEGDIYVTQSSPNVVYVFAESGAYLGELTGSPSVAFSEACGVTVDPDGNVYVGDFGGGVFKFSPTASPPSDADFVAQFQTLGFSPCTLTAARGASSESLFTTNFGVRLFKQNSSTGAQGYQIGTETATTAAGVPGTAANVLVADGDDIVEYDASGVSEAVERQRATTPSKVQGVAVAPSGTIYVSRAGSASIEVFAVVSLPTVTTGGATEVGLSTATLTGSVDPEGSALVNCQFEVGTTAQAGFPRTIPCESDPSGSTPSPVEARISGLQPDTIYRARLSATNTNGASEGATITFRTAGPPEITEVRARDANQTSAILEAVVDPRGFTTSFQFEWGPSDSYGNSVGAGTVAAGGAAAHAVAQISGLQPGTTYHYRVVATNGEGRVTTGPDALVATLDSCGLPDQRCLELVSPAEIGPVALPGTTSNEELPFQAALRPGSLIYSATNGLPGTTKGAVVLYEGTRSEGGWSSTQYSPPIIDPSHGVGPASRTATTNGISAQLDCGFVTTNQFLPGTPARGKAILEAGGSNLYRRNADGSYTLVTSFPPENLELVEMQNDGLELYGVAGFSEDCQRVIFSSHFRYPGVAAVITTAPHQHETEDTYVYEWDEGRIRSIVSVPGPGGVEVEVPPPATGRPEFAVGSPGTNGVSEDGSRVFFKAERQTGNVPQEIGKSGVFVRESGVTTDISLSQTTTPDVGATFQYATPDGSRAFFTANYGLTDAASNGPQEAVCAGNSVAEVKAQCDLYEYDLTKQPGERLTDLTATTDSADPEGAEVAQVLGTSADGSQVYFVAGGQLVPGQGPTPAQNKGANTLSVYGERGGVVSFAGVISREEVIERAAARVTPDGRYLLFQTTADVTGYNSGGRQEVYLYDADAPNPGRTVCVSCRTDGKPSLNPSEASPLGTLDRRNPLHPGMALVERGDEPLVFFVSRDALAVGAKEGVLSLYEWSHDQVFAIASEPPEQTAPPQPSTRRLDEFIAFAGASAEGTDLYFAAPGQLTWEDLDDRNSVYDARVDGGHPEPPPPSAPCSALTESSCQSSSAAPSEAAPPATSRLVGPGNLKQCPKGTDRKGAKCVRKRLPKRSRQGHKKSRHHKKSKHHKKSRHSAKAGDARKNHASANLAGNIGDGWGTDK
jgi:hypothetical protein